MIDEINHRASKGMCKPTKNMSILEIGAYEGDATIIFTKYFRFVTTVDPWKSGIGDITNEVDMEEIYKKFNLNTKDIENLFVLRLKSLDLFDYWKGDFFECDIVYIDAIHTYEAVKKDIGISMEFINPGGILAGHDYRDDMFPGVVRAVDEIGGPDCVFSDSSWIKHA